MEPLKTEIDAMRDVLLTPVESFVTDRERDEKGDEWAEKLAHKRMFAAAIKAVDKARGERTTWTVVLRFGGGSSTFYSGFGPYATKGQAEKALEKLAPTLGPTAYAFVPTRNAESFAALLDGLDDTSESKGQFGEVRLDAEATRNGWGGRQKDRHKFLKESV